MSSQNERLLPLPAVKDLVGFKSSWVYAAIKAGEFPGPIKIGAASRWRQSDIQKWIASKAVRS